VTIEQWLEDSKMDAYRRKLPELAELLEGLARSTATLRAARWNDDAANGRVLEEVAEHTPRAPRAGDHAARGPGAGTAPRTITEIAPRLARGELKSEALVQDALARIAELNPRLNAFITLTADEALAAARDADREAAAGHPKGPLHGIPISIKDLFDVAGVATTAGSRLREEHRARADASAVRHLRNAGAVLLGKTNLHEFAFGTTNEDSGWGPARHPIDPKRSPGGSSGGSAVSVATGMAMASLGSDTGGSIRIPAAACGLVGLKPTWGEVPADGVVPLSRQLDHVGPLTRSVADAATLFHILRGDAVIPTLTPRSVDHLRLRVLGGYFFDRIDEEVERRLFETIDVLQQRGAAVDEVSLPHTGDIAAIYLHLVLPDAAAYHATAVESRPSAYTPNVRLRIEMGRYVLAEDYARAQRGRTVLGQAVDRALSDVDALILPSLAIPAPPLGAATVPVKGGTEVVRSAMLRCTQPFNLSGHPAISLPCGTTSAGLPVGLQIVGRRDHTADLLSIALTIERALADA
jgi:aspartyl-tRNA(Asn)/glutamyl-tRNA(Gln) amidotransferase subunit A